LTAVFTLLILEPSLGNEEALASVITVFIGSVIPDVDHKKAYIHRSVKSFLSIASGLLILILLPIQVHYRFLVAALVFIAVYVSVSWKKMQHRGFTHSISFLLIISSLTLIVGKILTGSIVPGAAMALGVFSHLLLDRELKLS
jgi:membrane-bound metal-dependent hydrolase YbcI (DUF457 family)